MQRLMAYAGDVNILDGDSIHWKGLQFPPIPVEISDSSREDER